MAPESAVRDNRSARGPGGSVSTVDRRARSLQIGLNCAALLAGVFPLAAPGAPPADSQYNPVIAVLPWTVIGDPFVNRFTNAAPAPCRLPAGSED